ncbi:DUF3857 domain-containing protein [Cyclobacterium plantarum]|uniref:DUF3857 domain-containing protein n=1 Tax=Cyclobacterium plantarum TaxID=2716263 RepID=UPI003F715F5A
MKNISSLFLLGLISIQCLAFQANVSRSPAPDWLDPFPISKPAIEENWSYYYLDFERQIHLPKQTTFHHYRYQALTADGIQEMSDISIEFDPSFQKLIFHKIGIERDNKFLNQLNLDKVTTASTESTVERHLYDGSMTALLHLDGVQKGDIIVLSYSIKGFNPVHQGHFSTNLYHGFTIPVNHFNYRVYAGNNQVVYHNDVNIEMEPSIREETSGKVYTWTSSPEKPIELDNNLPVWTLDLPMTAISTQKNWREVVQWAMPLYRFDSNQLTSPIQENLETREKALALIRWVQDEIRYLGLESGIGAYKPNPPPKVYRQKFGDCKDKSLLLVALLKKEGIDAFPLLVNTTYRHNLNKIIPSNSAFDHCVVSLTVDNKNYFVDPTMANQGGDLDHSYFPDYGYGLLIKDDVSELIPLPKPKKPEIDIQEKIYVDSIGGQAMMEIKTIYKGAKADNIRSEFENNPLSSIQKEYLNFYNNLYPGIIETQEMQFYDEQRNGSNEILVKENYKIGQFWLQDEDNTLIYSRIYPLVLESMINYPGATARKSPYALGYPFTFKQETQIMLPEPWTVKDTEVRITEPTYDYSNQIKGFGERISVKYSYDLKQDFLEGELVPEFLSDHEKIRNDLMFTLTYNPGLIADEKSGLALFVFFTVLITTIFFGIKIYRHYDPKPWIYAENKGIGGWLILPAIGLTITPFRITYDFTTVGYLNKALWSNAAAMNLTEAVAFELVYNTCFLVFSILLIVLFYSRRTSIPRLMTIFYATNLVAILTETALTYESVNLDYQLLVQATVAAIIWIPYFNISETVKSTFCKTRKTIEPEPNSFPISIHPTLQQNGNLP